MIIYKIADFLFVIFHSALIIFNLFGWIPKPTRKINLLTLTLTGASWFILGVFYGIGYCPLTDWHFTILYKLGNTDLPYSYIKYLVDRIFNCDINARLVDISTLSGFIIALFFSIFYNIKDLKAKRKK